MANSLPFNSTMGLNWSDAYIGLFFPSLPPHLGLGFSTGYTTMDFGSMNGLLDMFDVNLPGNLNFGGFPLFGYTVEARVGGIILPFDVGLKFGFMEFSPDFLNNIGLGIPGFKDFSMDYMLLGADLRYAVVKSKVSPFKVSIGAGFNYLKGGMSIGIPGTNSLQYDYSVNGDDKILKLTQPRLGLDWSTKSLDFKAQASVSLLIFTPYLGIGASHAWSNAGYGIKSELLDENDDPIVLDAATKDALAAYGLGGISANGFSHYNDVTGWSFRTFGGFSINLPFVKLDFTGMYDFLSGCYGVTFGTRFQL